MTFPKCFSITVLLFISHLGLAQVVDADECIEYFPLSADKILMVEELTRALQDIKSPASSYDKKVAFFQSILPDVVAAMSDIEKERRELIELLSPRERTQTDQGRIRAFMEKYEASSTEELLIKVNTVPIDLVLVQSAIESGWGESPAAANCNNFLGLHAYDGLSVCNTPSRKLAAFTNRKESFKSYLLSLNRNEKYKEFRQKRAELLSGRRPFTGTDLAPYLLNYSVRGEGYTQELSQMIEDHKIDNVISRALRLADLCGT